MLSAFAAVAFLLISGHAEPVYWVSATGFLFASFFTLVSLVSFISWLEQKRAGYFVLTVIGFVLAPLFHELGIVAPLLCFVYARVYKHRYPFVFFATIPMYLVARFAAGSHWFSGDYSYNLVKLPLNLVGNAVGYMVLGVFGPLTLPIVQTLRSAGRNHMMIAGLIIMAIAFGLMWAWRTYGTRVEKEDRRIVLFGMGFFFVALLPFLGLGNMTSRYSYLSSVGIVILLVYSMKKLFQFVSGNGRMIAVLVVVIVSGTLTLLQLIQHQQMQRDWYDAGEISRKFVVAMDGAYEDYWRSEPMEFHFINVPIRTGDAWVFPVGIPDALWLVFRNPNIRVFSWPTVAAAFNAVDYDAKNQKVFEFASDGKLIERRKIRTSF